MTRKRDILSYGIYEEDGVRIEVVSLVSFLLRGDSLSFTKYN